MSRLFLCAALIICWVASSSGALLSVIKPFLLVPRWRKLTIMLRFVLTVSCVLQDKDHGSRFLNAGQHLPQLGSGLLPAAGLSHKAVVLLHLCRLDKLLRVSRPTPM